MCVRILPTHTHRHTQTHTHTHMALPARQQDAGRIGAVLVYQPLVSYCCICVGMLLYMCPHTTSSQSSHSCTSMRTHNIQEMTVTHISLSHPLSSFASSLPTPTTCVPSSYYICVLITCFFPPPFSLAFPLFFSSTSKVKSQRGQPHITSTVAVATATKPPPNPPPPHTHSQTAIN